MWVLLKRSGDCWLRANGLRLKAVRAITTNVARTIKVKNFLLQLQKKENCRALIAFKPLLAWPNIWKSLFNYYIPIILFILIFLRWLPRKWLRKLASSSRFRLTSYDCWKMLFRKTEKNAVRWLKILWWQLSVNIHLETNFA